MLAFLCVPFWAALALICGGCAHHTTACDGDHTALAACAVHPGDTAPNMDGESSSGSRPSTVGMALAICTTKATL